MAADTSGARQKRLELMREELWAVEIAADAEAESESEKKKASSLTSVWCILPARPR
jgi:hypothetical protein